MHPSCRKKRTTIFKGGVLPLLIFGIGIGLGTVAVRYRVKRNNDAIAATTTDPSEHNQRQVQLTKPSTGEDFGIGEPKTIETKDKVMNINGEEVVVVEDIVHEQIEKAKAEEMEAEKEGEEEAAAAADDAEEKGTVSDTISLENNTQGPWPECIGMTGQACVDLIEKYVEDVRGNVMVVAWDMMVTMDYRTDRVRVWTNEQGLVERAPQRG